MASATRPFHTRNPGLPGRCVDTVHTVSTLAHVVSDLYSPEYPRALVVYDSFLVAPTLRNLNSCPSVVFKPAPLPQVALRQGKLSLILSLNISFAPIASRKPHHDHHDC